MFHLESTSEPAQLHSVASPGLSLGFPDFCSGTRPSATGVAYPRPLTLARLHSPCRVLFDEQGKIQKQSLHTGP